MVDSTSGGWGEGRQAAPGAGGTDWKVQRLGLNPPATVPTLRMGVAAQLLAAAGVPVALLGEADGTNLRESTRIMLPYHAHTSGEDRADGATGQA